MCPQDELLDAIAKKASYNEIYDIVQKLDSINYGDNWVNNPLLLLMMSNYVLHPEMDKILQLFINKGVDLNKITSPNFTALYIICDNLNPIISKCFKIMLKNGANPDINRNDIIKFSCPEIKEILELHDKGELFYDDIVVTI